MHIFMHVRGRRVLVLLTLELLILAIRRACRHIVWRRVDLCKGHEDSGRRRRRTAAMARRHRISVSQPQLLSLSGTAPPLFCWAAKRLLGWALDCLWQCALLTGHVRSPNHARRAIVTNTGKYRGEKMWNGALKPQPMLLFSI